MDPLILPKVCFSFLNGFLGRWTTFLSSMLPSSLFEGKLLTRLTRILAHRAKIQEQLITELDWLCGITGDLFMFMDLTHLVHCKSPYMKQIGQKYVIKILQFIIIYRFGAENLEDYADCDGSGYAMDINQHVGLRQFFSPCSDHLIHDFIMSDNATCLKHLNHLSTAPVLDPDFDTALVPHLIQEYCRNLYFEGEVGVIAPEDVSNCKNVRCRWWKSDYEVEFSPLDNTRCGHNRVRQLTLPNISLYSH